MDPAWLTIILSVLGSVIGGAFVAAAGFVALRVWMARREEREEVLREDVKDHEQRLRELERYDHAPLDYSPR